MSSANRSRREGWLKAGGFLLGVSAIAVAVATWRVPAGTGTPPAELVLTANQTGELAVSPAGTVLRHRELKPSGRSDSATARLRIRNQTAGKLRVALRVGGHSRDLDRLLRVEVEAGTTRLFAGQLEGLRAWTAKSFALERGAARGVRVRAWLPRSVTSGYEGRIAAMTLEFRARSRRGRA